MAHRSALTGFWLPALEGQRLDVEERPFGPGQIPVRVPVLTPERLRTVLRELRSTRAQTLSERRVADLLPAIEKAARSLTRPGERFHEELLDVLPELTGYSRRMIEIGLERMGEGWTESALSTALRAEFGSLEVLDEYRQREPGGLQRAYGPPLSIHLFSGNIPGVSVTSLIRALCVKSSSFGKAAAGEPYFAVCFARSLAEVDPDLASCLAITYWPGGDVRMEEVAFAEADAVIAYGRESTIDDIRRRLPSGVRFLAYPNRIGAALVARSALGRPGIQKLARSAAYDVATFDQQGCVSPHTIFVERGGAVDPLEFARSLADALEHLSREIPRRSLAPSESTAIHQLRAQAEMRGGTVLSSEQGTGWTVIVEERTEFEPSPLNRVIHLRPVDSLSDAVAALRSVGQRLQTVAVAVEGAGAGGTEALAGLLGAAGATRIVRVGEAAWPSPYWHHDGRFQFLDLVRFADLDLE